MCIGEVCRSKIRIGKKQAIINMKYFQELVHAQKFEPLFPKFLCFLYFRFLLHEKPYHCSYDSNKYIFKTVNG